MISFVPPKVISWKGTRIPMGFPYLSAILQGPPEPDADPSKRPRMELSQRAKIFAPFDALDGYSDAVRSKDVEYVEEIDLAEDGLAEEERGELARRLDILRGLTLGGRLARANRVAVTVTYFAPCEDENSFAYRIRGLYRTVSGICRNIDPVGRTITVGEAVVALDRVARIESADGVFDLPWEAEAP